MRRHILICGEQGAGKSALIQRLLAETGLPAYGFLTKKEAAGADGFHPIYLHPAGVPASQRAYTAENLLGACDRVVHNVRPEVFNTLGVRYLKQARPGGVLVMDELGFMEAGADAFVRAVFAALDGDIPILAAVKARYDVPFLNAVRAHPKAALYTLVPGGREALYGALLPIVRGWR